MHTNTNPESTVLSNPGAASGPMTQACNVPIDRRQGLGELESMLDDDEALEGVEAWLNQQELGINMGSRGSEINADMFMESSAGWLLRLVRHARAALAAWS
ncbi:hypothetical protein [Pollutimonas bauzanensis]|uniref:Uncharacterized protein n=1 Tax=Pollutimonas bauzanensis TaxID=658167 RepID=A0A1M5Q640_9BURK|nr:hypothetical protein [Pollutimonas bauzanensis]SHH09241.1 hypothetical protein SAMN04488135_102161 [Pollutimonas bauzanensis]